MLGQVLEGEDLGLLRLVLCKLDAFPVIQSSMLQHSGNVDIELTDCIYIYIFPLFQSICCVIQNDGCELVNLFLFCFLFTSLLPLTFSCKFVYCRL